MNATSAVVCCGLQRSPLISGLVSLPCTPGAHVQALDNFSVLCQEYARELRPGPAVHAGFRRTMVMESYVNTGPNSKRLRLFGSGCGESSTSKSVEAAYASSSVLNAYLQLNSSSPLVSSGGDAGASCCCRSRCTRRPHCSDDNSSTSKRSYWELESSTHCYSKAPVLLHGQPCLPSGPYNQCCSASAGQLVSSYAGRASWEARSTEHLKLQLQQQRSQGHLPLEQRGASQQQLLQLQLQQGVTKLDAQGAAIGVLHEAHPAGRGVTCSAGPSLPDPWSHIPPPSEPQPQPQPRPRACFLAPAVPRVAALTGPPVAVAAGPERLRQQATSKPQHLLFFAPATPPLDVDAPRECILLLCKALCMSESTTARLALHIWHRIRGLVWLLVSVRPVSYVRHPAVACAAAAASAESLYPVAALWLAAKLEERRREAPSVQILAAAARTLPSVLIAAELRVLQWCEWAPYTGFIPDDSHLLFDL